MGMNYEIRQVGDVTILELSGRLDVGVALSLGEGEGQPLLEVIRNLAQRGQKNIVLNLRDVAYIDSSGIGDLVGAATTLRRQGGDLRIVDPGMVVQKLLRITRVDTVIDVKLDETSALHAFSTKEG